MLPLSESRIVLISRRTRLEELIARFNTQTQARFYVEHLGADFSDYQNEHDRYHDALQGTSRILAHHGRLHAVERRFLSNYIFGKNDLIVALGQDGLVANTLKYLDGQPLIGINPDRTRWDGVLLPFAVADLDRVIPEALAGRRPIKEVTMAKATLNNGQSLYAVNDFFIGAKSHVSARYLIRLGDREERHSSSGIIISTGLGSTGWFKSVMAGATALAGSPASERKVAKPMPWHASFLVFSVREPFPSTSTSATLVHGRIDSEPLLVTSQMAENGVLFSDGVEQDYLDFNAGTLATITVAERTGRLVI